MSSSIAIPSANMCEECKKSPLFGVYNNRKLCISCRKLEVETELDGNEETVDHNGEIVSRPHISTPPLKNARSLVATLSILMEGLLNKSINPETARVACNISSETIKAIDLIWRMDRGKR